MSAARWISYSEIDPEAWKLTSGVAKQLSSLYPILNLNRDSLTDRIKDVPKHKLTLLCVKDEFAIHPL